MSKVLVIASHPDDEILGCGGTIALHRNNSDQVKIIFLSDGISSRNNSKRIETKKRKLSAKRACKIIGVNDIEFYTYPDNKFDNVPLLKIVKTLEGVIKKFKPNIIYTHSSYDLNIDHQITHRATMTACRPIKNDSLKEIYSFEVLSSTEWSINKNGNFFPNHFVDITKFFKLKIKAIKEYDDELRSPPHPRSLDIIKSHALVRGSSCGVKLAESFMLQRRVV